MQNLSQTKNQIQLVSTLKNIAQTYEEIAIMRMQKIRDKVLYTRDFLKRVGEVYGEVKYSYVDEVNRISKLTKRGRFFSKVFGKSKARGSVESYTTINKNNKTVSVLVTSNKRLIGPITSKVFSDFEENIKNKNTDIVIIGKKGKDLYDNLVKKKNYEYYDFPENGEDSITSQISNYLINFEKVDVFFGKYLNLVNQVGEKTNLSGEELKEFVSTETKKSNYLFEPSLKAVLNFFEVEIFAALFKQSIFETRLANLGSQIQAMEQTAYNSEERLKHLNMQKLRLQKSLNNKKQIQRLAGMQLWR